MWNNNGNGSSNTFKSLKSLYKASYDKPAKGVYLKQSSEQVYKPKSEFKKLKKLLKV